MVSLYLANATPQLIFSNKHLSIERFVVVILAILAWTKSIKLDGRIHFSHQSTTTAATAATTTTTTTTTAAATTTTTATTTACLLLSPQFVPP